MNTYMVKYPDILPRVIPAFAGMTQRDLVGIIN